MLKIDPERLCDKGAEGAVLGSMIVDHRCIPSVLEWVSAETFFEPEHKAIFSAILAVWRQNPGGAVDGVLLRSRLEEDNSLSNVGGLDYLRRVVESVPTAANAVYYAKRVFERARFRELVRVQGQIDKLIADGGQIDELIGSAQSIVMRLDCQRTARDIFPMRDHASQIAIEATIPSNAIATGFRGIDRLLGGVRGGDMVILAARPSMGKTALATAVAVNMARAGRRVVFITLEMSPRSLIERMIAADAGLNLARIKREPTQDDKERFFSAALALQKVPLTVVAGASTPEAIAAVVQTIQQGDGVDVVCVDYLGLMSAGERVGNRNEEVTNISRRLKLLAQKADLAVVVLSQLNRAVEARETHRPRLADLRDSGSIEQDADVVLFLHREDYYRRLHDPTTTEIDGEVDLIVAKNRNGPVGIGKLIFIEEQIRFHDFAHESTLR
jgi:replicative DNA helicase